MLEAINSGIVKAYVHTSMKIEEFKNSEKGVTAVEYAIVVAGVAAAAAVIFGKDGTVPKLLTAIFTKLDTTVNAFGTK